jgi:hypothetical protein
MNEYDMTGYVMIAGKIVEETFSRSQIPYLLHSRAFLGDCRARFGHWQDGQYSRATVNHSLQAE